VSATRAGDVAQVTVSVAVPPSLAFEIFTQEIDLWWKRGRAYRIAGRERGQLTFEPGVGGRLFETWESGGHPRTVVTGTVVAWDPPSLLAFEWRGVNFKPDEKTLVEVRFAETESGNTQVTLRHSGWAALPDDHPVRHGAVAAEFIRRMGMWWGALLGGLREHSLSR
jgi:uncharacterized protein YndB with AHSA1/START domain